MVDAAVTQAREVRVDRVVGSVDDAQVLRSAHLQRGLQQALLSARDELARYPAELFAPPDGAFVLLLRDGAIVHSACAAPQDVEDGKLRLILLK